MLHSGPTRPTTSVAVGYHWSCPAMYLKTIAVENAGPITNLRIELPFRDGLPLPLVLVGPNGTVNAPSSPTKIIAYSSEPPAGNRHSSRSAIVSRECSRC